MVAFPVCIACLWVDSKAIRPMAAKAKVSPVQRLPPVTTMVGIIGQSPLWSIVIDVVISARVDALDVPTLRAKEPLKMRSKGHPVRPRALDEFGAADSIIFASDSFPCTFRRRHRRLSLQVSNE